MIVVGFARFCRFDFHILNGSIFEPPPSLEHPPGEPRNLRHFSGKYCRSDIDVTSRPCHTKKYRRLPEPTHHGTQICLRRHARRDCHRIVMMFDLINGDGTFSPMLAVIAIITLVELVKKSEEHARQRRIDEAEALGEAVLAVMRRKRRGLALVNDVEGRPPKQQKNWDHDRARQCIHSDWLGPSPFFDDRTFERTFRVTRRVADNILETLARSSSFFREGTDVTGKAKIDPKAKLLMTLKMLAYGNSPSAFMDFFQIGETTARRCLKNFTTILSHDKDLRGIFLRTMSRTDARRVSALHEEVHRVPGMIGSLDCMHVAWRTCPIAWQGQFQGKESSPTIVLEALADHNLWFWHHAFGYAGTLNDINIFDQSPLLKAFLDSTFTNEVDFSYELGGNVFAELFVLVDGIYPEIARFVKTFEEPIGERNKTFAIWQESSRKDIERAFGVLQRKFHVLVKPFELWYATDISDVVETCILLHNMMVSERVARDEMEEDNWYEFVPEPSGEETNEAGEEDPDEEFFHRRQAEVEIQHRFQQVCYRGNAVDLATQEEARRLSSAHYSLRVDIANRRWMRLYDKEKHLNLRAAIIKHLH